MKLISFIFITLFVFSCSKGSSSHKRETRIEGETVDEIMDHQNFECASLGGRCPPGIARLLIVNRANPEQSALCSGFVVGQKLITNHHCVSTPEECANTNIAIFDGVSYLRTKCAGIVKTDQDAEDPNDPTRRIDFTVMTLKDVYTGKGFLLSSNRARPGDDVHTWVIDHTGLDIRPSNLNDSRITEFECQVVASERASLMMMNCPIISGNSGSPVVNSRGRVVAIVWGGTAFYIDSSFDLEERRKLNEEALATESIYFRDYLE